MALCFTALLIKNTAEKLFEMEKSSNIASKFMESLACWRHTVLGLWLTNETKMCFYLLFPFLPFKKGFNRKN